VLIIAAIDYFLEPRFWPNADDSSTGEEGNGSDAASAPAASSTAKPSVVPNMKLAFSCVAGLMCLSLAASLYPYERPRRLESYAWRLHEFRTTMGAWTRSDSRDVDRQFLGSVRFRDNRNLVYAREAGSDQALLFAASDNRRRRDKSSLSPKTRLLGADWEIVESLPIQIDALGIEGVRTIQQRGRNRMLSLFFQIGANSLPEESLRWLLAIDLRPHVVPDDILTVRIAIPIDESNPGRALARLAEFQTEIEQAVLRAVPRTG